ncbi:glycerol-3-phosphate transporter ATP-binding subunit [Caballeronia calidae]|uniref:Glycerol-3-phosphate transporter ATP-binding subunit n=1 Tax=Caballeronia calidae TaxID=1777139 RepID=A0A158DHU5_9BURK|nr:sn-glycerol-3-phosphate import ATP-binding protein UgpC [Caballeronia calidae]SAK94179.1 glycerol-3-phosphate transporter ATP-binding subunit [Caballeronia calidae]
MAALNLKGVKKTYDGSQYVLHGIDVAIEDGEFVVMVGPSGCGKSTLLRMVAGLESVSEGAIEIGGKVVNKLEPKDRDIAMVFQNYALYPHMSVAQNMAYALKIGGADRATIDARVANAARILELEHLLARKPRELSGGQRQRVAMGRAIVREPAVFLFDEPLSNLDAKLRVQMRLEIQRLHARLATTSLYVTHDQIEAMTLAQRVIVMNKGHAEQIGAPTEVYERPATVFVASFIGSPAMNLLEGRLSEDGSTFDVAGDGPRLPVAGANGVTSAMHGREWIVGIRPEHMTPGNGSAPGATLDVDSAELLGADNLAHGKWGKHDVAARLPHEHRPQRGERLAVSLPAKHLHFFDPATGRRAN